MKFSLKLAVALTLGLGACASQPVPQPETVQPAVSEPASPELTPEQEKVAADAAQLCTLVPEHYVFFAGKENAWATACAAAPAAIAGVETKSAQLRVLEDLLDVLYDPHVSFGANSAASPRLVPSGNDYWLENGIVTGVRPGGMAALAGLNFGDEVVAVDGQPLEDAIAERIRPEGAEPAAAQIAWAEHAAAAGYRDRLHSVTVRRGGQDVTLLLDGALPDTDYEPVTASMLPGGIGYIRFNNSLGDGNTVPAFDAAMETLKGARAWVLDLRDTPGGGSTDIAEPVMGRFIDEAGGYQLIRPPGEPEWVKTVSPHGVTAEGPLAVLVGHWTGSMGEGMAVGLDGLRRADVFGNDMAGLAGGVDTFILDATGLAVNLPTYDLAHIDGTPRYAWNPPHPVIADNGAGPDLALKAATDWIRSFED
ncbi:MAG: S41 family peptidase [Hyphomonas sp.]|uniref:S41 family peptidase n=1 Tax=Hyphomonas sp. TaxID=87 RepID=UPI0035291DA5